ncbi:tripartite ATP-independent transporter DctM subunit [Clostridium tetanomorphum]|uniref:TRAP transporter large permease n=1 Tax=Clostridium tetanomorphum TaxID=1553 RepID=A0A923E5J6_CLOTT|nr:TRAP transporter large permease [Clostridium tetanomorphum]KAJ52606.1 putative TRAP C4-dicarboxylate transport system permease [Clostridium tetanomorphum DSM 665]MBC2396840.1 TRAP transporter large permease [Clostridium tetanomorphum]MBP1863198.1 tripartite ATP-independent transporter DctM subunit [Clostridium tetanomorphum]NRS84306.1 tripartite ATP-independent transporter DctM subunit [Clostridium tetanomorphum]NRZ97520.1 tripartite ATP-independent transporter DctM subunit [Clostridium tet
MSIALISGLIIAIVLIVLLLAGIPIAIALGISSILAILPTLNFDAAVLTGAQRTFSGISVFTLIAIPFFILAGNIMNKGGIALRLINFAKILTGRVPGALAHTNSIANMMFGAISGSGVAAASAMGSMIGPIAEKDGYDRDYMATVNIATAPTGLLIPPSNVLITYSLVSGGTSVAALFMAGYIPGFLWGLGCMLVAYFIARKNGYRSTERVTLKQALKVTLEAIPSLLLIIIVIGGIIAGIFTATEGSVVAVVYSLILSLFFYKTIKFKDLYEIFKDSAEMTGIIVFLIGVSSIMAWVMAFTGIPTAISKSLLSISSNQIVILLIINIVLLFVGTFMDITPAILIFTPIFLPICKSFGMSAIQFGIMITFNLCIGTITPPVGNILFVGVKVAKTKIENVMKKLIPYYVAIFIVLMLTTYVPKVSMWLPLLMGYKK